MGFSGLDFLRGLHWVLLGLLSHYLVLHGFTQLDSVLLCFHASTWLYRVLKGLIGSYKVLQGFTWFHQISATFMDVYRHFLYGEQTTTWMVGGRGRIDRSNSRAKKKKIEKEIEHDAPTSPKQLNDGDVAFQAKFGSFARRRIPSLTRHQ